MCAVMTYVITQLLTKTKQKLKSKKNIYFSMILIVFYKTNNYNSLYRSYYHTLITKVFNYDIWKQGIFVIRRREGDVRDS